MTNTYSTEAQLQQNTPKALPNAAVAQGRVKRARNTITLAGQLAADTVTLLPLPIGHVFCYGMLNGPSLGSTTISIGVTGTTDKYRADATFTAAVPTLFGKTDAENDDPATAVVTPLLTFATATAPVSGVLTVDFYYSQAS